MLFLTPDNLLSIKQSPRLPDHALFKGRMMAVAMGNRPARNTLSVYETAIINWECQKYLPKQWISWSWRQSLEQFHAKRKCMKHCYWTSKEYFGAWKMVLGQFPTRTQLLPTRTTIPRTIPHQDNFPPGPLPTIQTTHQDKYRSVWWGIVLVGSCPNMMKNTFSQNKSRIFSCWKNKQSIATGHLSNILEHQNTLCTYSYKFHILSQQHTAEKSE